MVFSSLLIAALLPLAAQAANDWNKPCFGECNWDISEKGSGTVRLTGTHSSVSDLTTAAGWTILDCDPHKANQDIRLVCHDPSKGCDHINNDGAAGTIVRLPKSCGSVPFALVTRHWVHKDQSIPSHKRSLLETRDAKKQKVMGTTLSTSFANGDHKKKGPVTLHLVGSSLPGAAGSFTQKPHSKGHHKRGVLSWVKRSLQDLSKVHKNLNGSAPLHFKKDVPLFHKSISCPQKGKVPGFTGDAKVHLDTKVTGHTHYGVAASGTLVPPKLKDFGLFVGFDMDLLGTLGLENSLAGSLSTGKIPLFTTGIPGLDYPGLFSIGPTFTVNAEGTATLDADVKTNVDIDYKIKGAELFFPPQGKSNGQFVPGDSSIQLSVSPGVTSHGQVAAHLIPTLSFGISALDGKAKATIDLEVDGEAAVNLSLAASAKKSKKVKREAPAKKEKTEKGKGKAPAKKEAAKDKKPAEKKKPAKAKKPAEKKPAKAKKPAEKEKEKTKPGKGKTPAKKTDPAPGKKTGHGKGKTPAKGKTPTKGKAPAKSSKHTFGGCFDITSGLTVSAGANADFLSIFDKSTSVNLFKKSFNLYKKCFGSKARRADVGFSPREDLFPRKAGLSCPAAALEKALSLTKTKVSGKSLH